MKKALAIGVMSTALIATVFSPESVSKASAATNSVHLSLQLNEKDDAKHMLDRDPVKKGNQKIFHHSHDSIKKTASNLDLDFKVTASTDDHFVHISGTGIVQIEDVKASISMDNDIDKMTLPSGKVVYMGPVDASFDFGSEGTKDGIVGLLYDPTTGKAQVTLTVGSIGPDGNALLIFGDKLPEQKQIIEKVNEMMKGLGSDQADSVVRLNPNVGTTSNVMDANVSLSGDYRYKVSADATTMRWQNNSSSSNTGFSVAGVNVFSRDPGDYNNNGSGSVLARAWSNSTAVKVYVNGSDGGANSTTAGVSHAYLSFTDSDSGPYMNITNAGPADSEPISAYSWIQYIPVYGSYLDMVANGVVAIYNSNPGVSSTKTYDTAGFNRIVYWKKTFGTIGNSADVSSLNTYASDLSQTKTGGLQASFDYMEYAGGTKTLVVGARFDYLVNDNWLYFGYFYTDAAMARWSANFMQ